jgi:hypothetical protein
MVLLFIKNNKLMVEKSSASKADYARILGTPMAKQMAPALSFIDVI